MDSQGTGSEVGRAEMRSWRGAEKRYLPRWEVDNRVICRKEKEESSYECRSVDLSCSGVSFVTREDLSKERRLRMEIFLSPKKTVNVEGYVVWSRDADYGHVVGVHFDTATEKVQELILKHAFEVRQENLSQHWFEGWTDGKKK